MNQLPRAAFISVAAVVLLALLTPAALAQVPQPGVTVTLDQATLSLGASNSTTVNGTVTYSDVAPGPTGPVTQGAISLAIVPPAGWNATIEPASTFTLAPGASADFTVTFTAPAAGAGAATGNADLTATATSSGGRGATGTASIALTRVDPPPPPPVPWYKTPIGIAGIVLAILLVVGAVAGVVWRNKQKRIAAQKAAEHAAWLDRETGIQIQLASGPVQYGHKREIVYRLSITNTSNRPRTAILDVAQATNGWRAATQVPKLTLAPKETQQTTLVVTPDAVITPGDQASVVVRVKPEEAREKDERLSLHVVAPKHGVPTDPHYRIVSVHREGAGVKPR